MIFSVVDTVVSALGSPEMSVLIILAIAAGVLSVTMGVVYVIKNGFVRGAFQMLAVAAILVVPIALVAVIMGRSPEESPEVIPSRANVEVITTRAGSMASGRIV